jgi:hypothetical protein
MRPLGYVSDVEVVRELRRLKVIDFEDDEFVGVAATTSRT